MKKPANLLRPDSTRTSMERPYRFGTVHGNPPFKEISLLATTSISLVWLLETVTGCIAHGEDATPHRLVSVPSA